MNIAAVSTSGWIALALLAALVLFAPKVGVRSLWLQWRRVRRRRMLEDALKHLLACEHAGRAATVESLAGALGLSRAALPALVVRMENKGLVRSGGGVLHLTADGERWAMHVVRAHRLWERYLADEAGMPMTRIHRAAERAEHRLSPDQLDVLDAHLGYPATDPHGDPIPTADGVMAPATGKPLTDWPQERLARIVHVEDEPEAVFQQILAEGLAPGQILRVLERTTQRLVISSGQHEHRLAPVVAANIQVTAADEEPASPPGAIRLSDLANGESGRVVALDDACRGFVRRRLLDMGLTAGAEVCPELSTALGDPRAIRVRGTLIALRREQASQVWVRPADGDADGKEKDDNLVASAAGDK